MIMIRFMRKIVMKFVSLVEVNENDNNYNTGTNCDGIFCVLVENTDDQNVTFQV